MTSDNIFTAVNMTYIMGILLAIAFLLAYIAGKISKKKPSKK